MAAHWAALITWTDAGIAKLRELWDEGHSAAEIARRMGTSKNSILGKVHRAGLPPRGSPIKKEGYSPPKRQPGHRILTGPTLPPLPSVAVAEIPTVPEAPAEPSRLAERIVTVMAVPRSPVAAPRPTRAFRAPAVTLPKVAREPAPNPYGTVFKARVGCCTWTDSEAAPWIWCEAPTLNGGSWCEDHRKRVFHRVSLQPVERLAGLKEAAD